MKDIIDGFISKFQLPPEAGQELSEMLRGSAASGFTTEEFDSRMATGSMMSPSSSPEEVSRRPAPAPAPIEVRDVTSRFEDMGLIGRGGMGEVRRIFDRTLRRRTAMKLVKPETQHDESMLARFIAEAQVTAQLQHPSIVPVYDLGKHPDGRLYFTMKEVQGRTLLDVLQEVHQASRTHEPQGMPEWRPAASGWTLRRLIDAFLRVCEGVAFAHSRGVLHRDIKPLNLMVGEYGETLILDWGLAKVLQERAPLEEGVSAAEGGGLLLSGESQMFTLPGSASGTPGYMAPEQAAGRQDLLDPTTDVYALGATLLHVLTGNRPPHGRRVEELLPGHGPGAPASHPPLPEALRRICLRAMAWEQSQRYPDAGALAEDIRAWLDGERRQEEALALVAQVRMLLPEMEALRAMAAERQVAANHLLQKIPPFAPVEDKIPGWDLQDEAARLRREAELKQHQALQLLQAALTQAPDLREAHALLAQHYRRLHEQAERLRDEQAQLQSELLLRVHDRGEHSAYLLGPGAVSLVTNPPGAEVTLHPYESRDRHLIPAEGRRLGVTPLHRLELPMGSYLLRIHYPGRVEVKYPIHIDRLRHWDGVPEGESAPQPIYLPRPEELLENDCYVPAGWFWSGGDPKAQNSLPLRRLWLDGFVMKRFPVTLVEYLDFLNDLVARGQREDAERHVPPQPAWEEGKSRTEQAQPFIERSPEGGFFIDASDTRRFWPVTMINWHSADAYARWRAEKDGVPWRLCAEMEYEKSARGTDGRHFPWGDFLDPTFCHMRHSLSGGRATKVTVDRYPIDESPYGVRGMAGNVHQWCQDAYQVEGPRVVRGRPVLSNGEDISGPGAGGIHRIVKGAPFHASEELCRSAYRNSPPAVYRDVSLSFRLARPFPSP
ncbi:SUMF1/EgtB/PvdO family nonheme iron enzyme [Archangium violaceum]|uniref:protein kinase domain-containing protein n=1 Tax=Archangium violaceum TaxID=83451 RepID=UPI0019518FC9|nr:SUMF1/EgtB/PvdO family nonheme iron enzyme [Archangium violaceum]QRN96533.1 SUMF1/EgtB/PvdO family nonheme iron enzyme [Archangium violaceum]